MKKAILIGALIICGFKTDTVKTYKLEFNDVQLNALWNCLDNSNAPHNQVKEIQALIQQQLKSQLPKPPIDSMKTKK